jgi:hypothetical protein
MNVMRSQEIVNVWTRYELAEYDGRFNFTMYPESSSGDEHGQCSVRMKKMHPEKR